MATQNKLFILLLILLLTSSIAFAADKSDVDIKEVKNNIKEDISDSIEKEQISSGVSPKLSLWGKIMSLFEKWFRLKGPNDDLDLRLCEINCLSCDAATLSCASCPAGFRTAGNGCLACTPGTYKDSEGPSACVQCEKNYISSLGAKECFACPSNLVSNYRNDDCIQCRAGTEINNGNCFLCKGNTISEEGKSCAPCEKGLVANEHHTECVLCSPGYEFIDEKCVLCEDGFVSIDGNTCEECKYNSMPDEDNSECIRDPNGVCNEGCIKCSGECIECMPGFYMNVSTSECSICPVDHYCDGVVKHECGGNNSYAPEGSSSCFICPEGEIADEDRTYCYPDLPQGIYTVVPRRNCNVSETTTDWNGVVRNNTNLCSDIVIKECDTGYEWDGDECIDLGICYGGCVPSDPIDCASDASYYYECKDDCYQLVKCEDGCDICKVD